MNQVTIKCTNPKVTLRIDLGNGPITVNSDAYGGFEVTARAKRVGLTTWNGFQPIQLTIPIIFDGISGNRGVETNADIDTLELLAGRGKGGGVQPPVVSLSAPGSMLPFQNDVKDWVINSLQLDDRFYNTYGNCIRAIGTMSAMQYVADKNLVELSSATRRQEKKGSKATVYTVREGDTLQSIARKYYGTSDDWQKIMKANPKVKDPRKPPKGLKLRIPAQKAG